MKENHIGEPIKMYDVMCSFFVFSVSLSLSRFLVHVFNHCMPPLRSLEDLGEGEMQALGLKELPVRGGACVAMWCVVLIQNALEHVGTARRRGRFSFMIVVVVLFVFAKFFKMTVGSQENNTARLNPFDEFFDR